MRQKQLVRATGAKFSTAAYCDVQRVRKRLAVETSLTRALDISQRQITALCKGAEKAGYAPIVQIGKVLVRLVPEDRAIHAQEKADVDEDEDIRL